MTMLLGARHYVTAEPLAIRVEAGRIVEDHADRQ